MANLIDENLQNIRELMKEEYKKHVTEIRKSLREEEKRNILEIQEKNVKQFENKKVENL